MKKKLMYHSGRKPIAYRRRLQFYYFCKVQNYRKTSHTAYGCNYHIVQTTKYCKKVLGGVVDEHVHELNREMCKKNNFDILKGLVSRDYGHLFVSVPPHLAISKLLQYLKCKSSYKLMQENKQISKQFRGSHIWARGYFVTTSGNITDEVIIEYINNQDDNKNGNEDFTVGDQLDSALAEIKPIGLQLFNRFCQNGIHFDQLRQNYIYIL